MTSNSTLLSNPVIQAFLSNRGLTAQDIDYLLHPNASHQHDVFLLEGVSKFIEQLHHVKGQSIAIIPDYDADGVLSGTVARIGLYLAGFGDVYLYPPRVFDGYGMTPESVENVLRERPDTQVILTTDNGSNASKGVSYAKDLGLTVLVTDHHLSDIDVGADAHVNPNQYLDLTYPYKSISGTTVVYKVLQAYLMKYHSQVLPTYQTVLPLVGMSVISDVMPLLNENRYYVMESVKMFERFVMRYRENSVCIFTENNPLDQYYRGIHLLVAELEVNRKLNYGIDSDMFGFVIGPMLNSPRRMLGESELGFNLFQTMYQDVSYGYNPASELYKLNEARKALVRRLSDELRGKIAKDSLNGVQPIKHAVFNAVMHAGVAGLLANTFTTDFGFPAVAFAAPENQIDDAVIQTDVASYGKRKLVGSARAPEGFNLHGFLSKLDESNPGLIESWGGHEAAAGITITCENFDAFREAFVVALEIALSTEQIDIERDAVLQSPVTSEYMLSHEMLEYMPYLWQDDMTFIVSADAQKNVMHQEHLLEAVRFLEQLGCYGQGFPKPEFSVIVPLNSLKKKPFYMGKEKNHVKLTLSNQLSIIDWNGADNIRNSVKNDVFVFTGTLGFNTFRGKETMQLIASDCFKLGF